MENTAVFSCCIGTTDSSAELGLEIWLDQEQIFNSEHITETIKFQHNFSEDDAERELRFVMKNKTQAHTQIDDTGAIIRDAALTIADVAFEEIQLGHVFVEQSTYTHDFNGTQPEVTAKFFGVMGCNGTVSLRFTTPIYLWLLEHL